MSYTEKTKIVTFDVNVEMNTVAIQKQTFIYKDDVEVARSEKTGCGFVPGDIEKVKEFLGSVDRSEIKYLANIWTDLVVSEYKEKQKQKDEKIKKSEKL